MSFIANILIPIFLIVAISYVVYVQYKEQSRQSRKLKQRLADKKARKEAEAK